MAWDVIVIGGGPAGLICAGTAARRGKKVLVAEKMERPARKILVTGKGRCNVTNNCDSDRFFAAVRNGGRFLQSAYSAFSAQDAMALVEGLGVPLKTERGDRVFPVSERAMDIADALVKYAKTGGAVIRRHEIEALWIEEEGLRGVVTADGERLEAGSVVVATGGLSYPGTGSTGDGYRLAEQAGHVLIPARASLIPIETAEPWCKDLMGLSLKNVELRVLDENKGKKKPVFREQGEMLFTHFGVSGPLVLSASAHMAGEISRYRLEIDLKPALTPEQLDARLQRDFGENSTRDFSNSLGKLLPSALIPVVAGLSGIPADRKCNQITKEQRRSFAALLGALPLTPKAFRPIEEAVITAGGVKLSEVSPKTMESKLLPGLHFAGEVLDLDAYTGGFNLQIAYSTGYAAGTYC
ncbi:MAG: NAD(P)/FAD-dependent oxidoreductase [Oscillospiraceae bacterium]